MKPKPFSELNHLTVPLAMPFAFQPISDSHRANPEVVVLVLRHCTANRPHSGAGGLGEPRHLLLTLHGMSEPHQ
ncbi:hypothetical protein SAM23877_7009 [Streptomyces ambofaciens ATCC 23877]|uniref:Uncharacterized protein n=1 Tax=Streptomyces ambofaciens (strain ATCC 23877 / 3486 / DSM 40053 / JCM 4204 / NBRC 12836 / NRRL B-2516) TaxID=278992 RepID=A0A0K2B460_STRA7|nr:hypothetical protein SAM23877_7009 [Streptomyces ambofaciens ATCC 23877]